MEKSLCISFRLSNSFFILSKDPSLGVRITYRHVRGRRAHFGPVGRQLPPPGWRLSPEEPLCTSWFKWRWVLGHLSLNTLWYLTSAWPDPPPYLREVCAYHINFVFRFSLSGVTMACCWAHKFQCKVFLRAGTNWYVTAKDKSKFLPFFCSGHTKDLSPYEALWWHIVL